MKTKGFTLVELLVVIAILAILATVSVVGYTSFINDAKNSNAETAMHTVETYIKADLMADNEFEVSETVVLVKDGDTYYTTATQEAFLAALSAHADIKPALGDGGKFTYANKTLTLTTGEGGVANWAIEITFEKVVE